MLGIVVLFIVAFFVIRYITKPSDNDYSTHPYEERHELSPTEKGKEGEEDVAYVVNRISAQTGAITMKDLYLPWPSGKTAQIDELIIADSGIYVIEMKNYKGWIFGNENNQYWTQVLYTGYRGVSTKYRLYNPIWQNQSHIKCIRKNLPGYNVPIHSIIVFSDEAVFKDVTYSSSDVHLIYMSDLTLTFRNIAVAHRGEVSADVRQSIKEILTRASSQADKANHVERVHHDIRIREERIEKGLCPKCGSPLVVRTVKHGPNAGSHFLGCSRYPDCYYTRNIR